MNFRKESSATWRQKGWTKLQNKSTKIHVKVIISGEIIWLVYWLNNDLNEIIASRKINATTPQAVIH